MADGKIEIDTSINTDKTESQLDKLSKKISGLADNKTLTAFSKLGNSVTGLKSAFSMVTGAIGKAAAAINETIELSNKQVAAETQLEAAAKNNPYLTESSVQKLKDYAGQLQSISTIGDEELLPMMAQLAAAGRTQDEIQDIMSAALDVSASGAMDLNSAVRNLNKTFGGFAGELGETNPQIKALTTEQLKAGEAVKILKNQYAGMSEIVSSKTGGWQQFKNSLGDFKEVIGSGFANIQNTSGKILSKFFDSITSKLKEGGKAADEFREKLGLITQNDSNDATSKSIQNEIDLLKEEKKQIQDRQLALEGPGAFGKAKTKEFQETKQTYLKGLAELQKAYDDALGENVDKNNIAAWNEHNKKVNEASAAIDNYKAENEAAYNAAVKGAKNVSKEYDEIMKSSHLFNKETLAADLKSNEDRTAALEKKLATVQGKEAELTEGEKRKKKLDEETAKINAQDTALKQTIAEIQKKAELEGKEASQQDILNAKIATYLAVWKESGPWAETYLSNLQKDINKTSEALEDSTSNFNINDTMQEFDLSLRSECDAASDLLSQLWEEGIISNDEYYENSAAIEKALTQITEEESEKRKQAIQSAMSTVNTVIGNLYSTMSTISETGTQQAEDEATAATAAIEQQYADGLISEDEYNEKKEKIEKEAAEKSYKLQMWAWGAQLLEIGSSTALAMMQTLADKTLVSTVAKIAMMATVGAMGAAQLAAAIANKPTPPSYASGGVIGGINGASMGGDNTYAHVRNGEMILNAKQQRALWETANSNGSGGFAMNVNVKNYASDSTQTSQAMTADGLEITITKLMEKKLSDGSLNSALTAANNSMNGTSYTN